jgi:hypothetical protein
MICINRMYWESYVDKMMSVVFVAAPPLQHDTCRNPDGSWPAVVGYFWPADAVANADVLLLHEQAGAFD